MPIAETPEPPYTAVIFTSIRTPGDNGYTQMLQRMETMAAEHLVAQQRGRQIWYDDYRVRVATVGRDYGRG